MGNEGELPVALSALPTQLQGRQGTYQIQHYRGQRGHGYLLAGTQVETNQPVVIKVYGLESQGDAVPAAEPPELSCAPGPQALFAALEGILPNEATGAEEPILFPQEVLVDAEVAGRCYLVTGAEDASPTLGEILAAEGALSPQEVRDILAQSLYALARLHQLPLSLPNHEPQIGLVHGNLHLESLLWVDQGEGGQVYLCDLDLWEGLFDPALGEVQHGLPRTVSQDLAALGQVALQLLAGDRTHIVSPQDAAVWPQEDADLALQIRRLLALAPPFCSAEQAYQALVSPPVDPAAPVALPPTPNPPPVLDTPLTRRSRELPWWVVVASGVGALVAMAGVFWGMRARSPLPTLDPAPPPPCCFQSVQAVPMGQFPYTALPGSPWSPQAAPPPANPTNGTGPGTTQDGKPPEQPPLRLPPLLAPVLRAQPTFQLVYRPTNSVEAAIAAVEAGQVAFAIVPLPPDLPAGLGAEIIAYDGLAVIVPAGANASGQSLPAYLRGRLTLAQLKRLYRGEIQSWQELGGPGLPVRLYAPANPEAIALFKQRLFPELDPATPVNPAVQVLPLGEMVRSLEQDWQTGQAGGIGFAPLSQILGDCTVYPLALKPEKGRPVQPVVNTENRPITPKTRLCEGTLPNAPATDPLVPGAIAPGDTLGTSPAEPLDILPPGDSSPAREPLGTPSPPFPPGSLGTPAPNVAPAMPSRPYGPDLAALATHAYPLAYPLAIVYRRDNRLPPVGKKFAELLRTQEGQELLQQIGLVPVTRPLAASQTTPTATTPVGN